ncbi:hypothetical protein [Brevibacillus laterosporus]|uniref:hypothetical protein n=1 Tax=Brevibacillus laterosporus TaxID=1465 RepID=UPI003D1A361C
MLNPIKGIMSTNSQVIKFLNFLAENHDFTEQEKQGLDSSIKHMSNLQEMFSRASKEKESFRKMMGGR